MSFVGLQNSFSEAPDPLGELMARPFLFKESDDEAVPDGVVKREEFVRIIVQALYSLGYERSGALLEEESGISFHSYTGSLLRKQVLDGNWDESKATLHQMGLANESILKSATLLILEQKFFQLLDEGRYMDGLMTLRNEIVPLGIDKSLASEFSSCVVSSSQCALPGNNDQGIQIRLNVLEELHKLIPSSILIPERRLEHLVEKALGLQGEACYFLNSWHNSLPIFDAHQYLEGQIPYRTTQILDGHHGEVWFLQFSNNGNYLASSSTDNSVIIWEVNEDGSLSLKQTLTGHQKPVLMVAWSPDDCQLLSCGLEEAVRCWEISSGNCVHVYEKTGVGSISCSWFPDGKWFLSAYADKTFSLWDLYGQELGSWKNNLMTKNSDIAVTKDGKVILSLCCAIVIMVLNEEANVVKSIKANEMITSFSLSTDDNFLLVNLRNQQIHLWSIDGYPRLVTKYKGQKRSRLIIRSCFAGFGQPYIASGSEDSQVYIWDRATGDLVEALPGHAGAVGCVSWSPGNPYMLASASDDHTIRIWGQQRFVI